MLIEKIKKIEDFGVFKNFRWGDLPEFSRYNFLYGPNYSGKTTLSRVFEAYERGEKHPDYPDGTFEIETTEGRRLNDEDLSEVSDVRVFNSDFVSRNLNWFNQDEMEPLFVLGEESQSLQEDLADKRESIKMLIQRSQELQEEIKREKDSLNKSLSQNAKNIKRTYSIPNYNRTKLRGVIEEIADDPEGYILDEDEFEEAKRAYGRPESDKKEQIQKLELPKFKLETLRGKADNLTTKQVSGATIDRLEDDPKLNSWVKEGKELHENEEECQFCTNAIPEGLVERYDRHFSDEYEKLTDDLEALTSQIEEHLEDVNEWFEKLPVESAFYPELQADFNSLLDTIKPVVHSYEETVTSIKHSVNKKIENPFESFPVSEDFAEEDTLVKNIGKINDLIQSHNDKTSEFEEEKTNCEEELKRHHAALFIDEHDYFTRLEGIQTKEEERQYIKDIIEEIKVSIDEIRSRLSDEAKAAEKVNEYMTDLFVKTDLEVEVTEDKKFRILREGEVARNLSEGERTAISFAYFLVRLEDRETDLEDTVVFIDDPVSSLDKNHLYSVYGVINDWLGEGGCEQLFVSTHNFEFYNLLKRGEWPGSPSLYYVKRHYSPETNHSSIEELPETLRKFRSEYVYLFSRLYEFYEERELDFDGLYLLPHIIRRVLEAYLGMRLPLHESYKSKLDFLIDDAKSRSQIHKFINDYSHQGYAQRNLNHTDLSECVNVVEAVVEGLKEKDPEHFEALMESVG